MEFYEIMIEPLSAFGTPLKGDTLFGQFCWQAFYKADLLKSTFEEVIAKYPNKPFAVFSSAFPVLLSESEKTYLLKQPDVPILKGLTEDRKTFRKRAKESRKKKWISVNEDLKIDFKNMRESHDKKKDKENDEWVKTVERTHNSINRMTGTTGKDSFAPYITTATYYAPETTMVVFVVIDEDQTDIERVCQGLTRIGKQGFGRDASTGMGRFKIVEKNRRPDYDKTDVTAIYTLAPSVPGNETFSKEYFKCFVRFGKHGDQLALARNPFKKPVMMADEGAIYELGQDKSVLDKPYIGKAVTNVSNEKNTVVQGYAPYLPVKNWIQ